MSLFNELKRRNVFRVGIAYGVASWVLLQVVDLVLDNTTAPDWVMHVFMLFTAIGFVAAIIISWAYEITPEGIKREADVDRSQSITGETGHKLDRIIIGFLAVAVVLLLADRFVRPPAASSEQPIEQVQLEPQASAKSIAVLPFADLSQARDQQWFADGLAEEILNALTKTPDLQVSSRTSTFRYKGSTLSIPEIAAELGVAHILEGSVRSSGNRIRVTAQLIRAEDGFHVWSENYDRDVADMISIQEDLAINIAKALKTTMDPEALAAMTRAGTRSVAAYEEYLRGLNFIASSVAEAEEGSLYLKAYDYFENARELDPDFAAAHFQSADFWRVQIAPSRTDSGLTDLEPHQALAQFNERIDQAIATASTEIDAQGYRALKAMVEMRLHEAISLFNDYLQARPNDEQTRGAQMDAASMASDQPVMQDIIAHWRERGLTDVDSALYYVNGAYQVVDPSIAADFGMQILQRWPNHVAMHYQVHRTLLWAGRVMEARQLMDRYNRLNPAGNTLLNARQACVDGRREEAELLLASIDPNENDLSSERWHILKMLGRDREANDELRPIAQSGIPYQIADMLGYSQFDPSPYPILVTMLERQGIERPPPVEIPFKCPPPEATSIAVLPFVNMSADAENEFFSDGIAEEILNVLASIPELKVAARTSAFAYKGSNTNISRIAEELGVNHILEGSVRKAGNLVRVTAQLIKADDGFHLWSASYDRELTNIFAIQDEIAGSIADALKVTLELEAGDSGNLTGTNSIEAYEHYLQGMQQWHLRTVDSLNRAITQFDAAIAQDPNFAAAHAGLALVWAVYDGYVDFDSTISRKNTTEAANQALKLNPDNVEALTALALLRRSQFRYDEAASLFEKAISLNPSFATAYQWYGGLFGEMSDPEAGLAHYQKAWSLDPRSRIIGLNLALHLDGLGRRIEALELVESVLEFAPDFPDGLVLMLQLQIVTGNCDAVTHYGNRLAAVLKISVNSTAVYYDLCQSADPANRSAAVKTIMAWPKWGFVSARHPALLHSLDTILIFVELEKFEEAWTLISRNSDSVYTLGFLRSRQDENTLRFRCDPRVKQLEKELEIPPPVQSLVCN